jgi:CDP-paratose 2-epimerase
MIGDAAYWAHHRGRRTVLGGMIPIDPHWLNLIKQCGALQFVDIVGVHGFPGMWFPDHPNWDWHEHWTGWSGKIGSLRDQLAHRPVWVTETGLATWDLALQRRSKYELQVDMLQDAAICCPAERIYWYSAIDLDPQRNAIEGFHVDENEYHMGLMTHDGHKKHAYFRMHELLSTQ